MKAKGNYSVNPHFSFSDHPNIDILVVVGGVHVEEESKSNVIDWIVKVAREAELVTSVCTGAFFCRG